LPALIFVAINYHNPVTIAGWATPVATDIAFALGVLSLLGRRVPVGLKLFLLALAIFDDVAAIIIIALFYSGDISWLWLFLSSLVVFFLYVLNRISVRSLTPYLSASLILWFCLLHAGVHPTIAGVILALMIPGDIHDHQRQPLLTLEKQLHPWVAFLIMPLFALANAGFSFTGLSWHMLGGELVLGIFLGLFVGKQIGVFSLSWLMIKCGYARLPDKSSWFALYGISLLCGIGFTMSLFLGTLSFPNHIVYLAEMRVGVMLASLVSGLVGVVVLFFALKKRQKSSRHTISGVPGRA
jgi:NhaA family Na+:H+ antiporter